MFGLSFTEVVIIAVLALILLGPDQLPTVARTVGKTLRELRRAADDLKDQISSEIDLGEVTRLGDRVSRMGDQLGGELSRLGEPAARAALSPVPAMPLPSAPAPEASAANVPGLEAALAEPEPQAPSPAPAAPGPAAPAEPAAPAPAQRPS